MNDAAEDESDYFKYVVCAELPEDAPIPSGCCEARCMACQKRLRRRSETDMTKPALCFSCAAAMSAPH